MKPLFFLLLLVMFLPLAYLPHAWSEPDYDVEPVAPWVDQQPPTPFESAMIAVLGVLIPVAVFGVPPFLIFVFLYRRRMAKKKQMSDDP